MKKIYLLLILFLIPIKVYAEEASNISNGSTYKINNSVVTKLSDNNFKTKMERSDMDEQLKTRL